MNALKLTETELAIVTFLKFNKFLSSASFLLASSYWASMEEKHAVKDQFKDILSANDKTQTGWELVAEDSLS